MIAAQHGFMYVTPPKPNVKNSEHTAMKEYGRSGFGKLKKKTELWIILILLLFALRKKFIFVSSNMIIVCYSHFTRFDFWMATAGRIIFRIRHLEYKMPSQTARDQDLPLEQYIKTTWMRYS